PMKLMIDEVRLWATGQGLGVFHLGGGATRRPDDSLLHFKMGFSDRTHEFAVWRWVLFPDVYQRLCEEKSQWNERHKLRSGSTNDFPEYRCRTVPCVSAAPVGSAPIHRGSANPDESGHHQQDEMTHEPARFLPGGDS